MVNLRNILPISKAASSLAALLKRAKTSGEAIIITQRGYPAGVLLSIEAWERLRGAYRVDNEGRDVTDLPGLWDERDTICEVKA